MNWSPNEQLGIDDALQLGYDNVCFPFAIVAAGIPLSLLMVILEFARNMQPIKIFTSEYNK